MMYISSQGIYGWFIVNNNYMKVRYLWIHILDVTGYHFQVVCLVYCIGTFSCTQGINRCYLMSDELYYSIDCIGKRWYEELMEWRSVNTPMHLARECWHVVASDVTGCYFQFLVAIYRHLYLYINPLVTDPLYLVYMAKISI